MILHNAGFNHAHDADFVIERPTGSGDYLLLLLKTDAIFTLQSTECVVPKNAFFLFRKGTPQYYRCLPQQGYCNDWVHFDLTPEEELAFPQYGIPFDTPVVMDDLHFLSYCVCSIVYEYYSSNPNRMLSVNSYLTLMLAKVGEQISRQSERVSDNQYDMLSTVRNKIYAKPYETRTAFSSAHEIRMSKSTFQHAYKKYFGTTFLSDLIRSRISYAQMLLTSSNLSIQEVAMQSGYSTYVHFSRQFKEITGTTPSEYRALFARKDI